MKNYFTTEEFYLMQKYGTESRKDTSERLKHAAAYSVDSEYKRLICELRETVDDLTDEQWFSFFIYYVKSTPLRICLNQSGRGEDRLEYV